MPFFDVQSTGQPWEFENNESPFNPLGLRGTWLMYDQVIPNGNDFTGFAAGDDADAIALQQGRTYHTMTRIPGEDGLLGTLDDRVAIIGGTDTGYPFFGDNAVSNSCEIFLPPEAGVITP